MGYHIFLPMVLLRRAELRYYFYWGTREWVSIFRAMVRWWVYLARDLVFYCMPTCLGESFVNNKSFMRTKPLAVDDNLKTNKTLRKIIPSVESKLVRIERR